MRARIRIQMKAGSAQESVETLDFSGLGFKAKEVSRSGRCCGNVETHALCGFPSTKAYRNDQVQICPFNALVRHFHSKPAVFRAKPRFAPSLGQTGTFAKPK